ncbi:MAG: biopolymer transporter ExbD [Halothiobacillaceae bacterium]|jgi:biopolymer transport protein ExbD|nr:biopolymer transporter ExbD [Halothiobacillaceae bacterium]MDY0050073.1 biopolymer transporter ExbD [Halothiobacillaceae bacterium]
MNFQPRRREELDLNLIPLIDVVFMLLIFFMVTTTFERETTLNIDLPVAGAEAKAPPRSLTLEIDRDGQYALNGERLTAEPDALRKALREARGEDKDAPPLLVLADGETAHQAVVAALDAAREAGLTHLSIATRERH